MWRLNVSEERQEDPVIGEAATPNPDDAIEHSGPERVVTTGSLLRERFTADLPDMLVATRLPDREPTALAKQGEGSAPDLLATYDPVIVAERLPEAARYIRNTLGYLLLTNITATDYLAAGLIEMIYHFAKLDGGAPVALKVRVGRDTPTIPSLTPWWPGADFQEREAFDLFGVTFTGHPNLRRIYMWDEFEGFPMRRDFPRHGDKYSGDS